ncbi:MAG TPA: heme-binding protein [Thermoanaerobaculia bacterium]|jgi:uncharacterized protein GlcG (DUF336 family)
MANPPQTPPALPLEYGPPISLAAAKLVMEAAEQEAARNRWPMVIVIVDSTGHLVMLHRMDQAQYGSLQVARLKAETAVNFRRPTRAVQDAVAAGGVGTRMLSVPDAIAIEGGIPLVSGGRIVGAIGVSGMQSGQDVQVAQAGADAVTA